jgi:uncharacterized protein YgbK (DUF1537 family)
MMLETEDLGIVADDLTGACDVAACFAPQVGSVGVKLSADSDSNGSQTLQVLNTQSRLRDCASARSILRQAGTRLASKRVVFKKIDTGLRGPIGAELAGLLEGLSCSGKRRTCVVAPAIPSIGRTTRQGVQYDQGIRIDQGALANDPDSPPPSADIRLVIRQTGGGDCLVEDAESQEELERVVGTYLAGGWVVFAGSLGLAVALANRLSSLPHRVETGPPARHPLLICGSRHPRSAAQLERAGQAGVRIIDFEPALLQFHETIDPEQSGPLLVRILPGEPSASTHSSGTILECFVKALCSFLEAGARHGVPLRGFFHGFDGLGIIGGETAYHTLRHLAAQRLEVFERQSEVIARSRIVGGVMDGCRFVCKGGSVGPEDAVLQMLSLLTEGRT